MQLFRIRFFTQLLGQQQKVCRKSMGCAK